MAANNLTGQLLLAMPGMTDPRFHKCVIFLCLHDDKGAMGLVLTNPLPGLGFGPLLEQLGIVDETALAPSLRTRPVFSGGPVEQSRGFLLHDDRFSCTDTILMGPDFGVTGTTEGLRALAQDEASPDSLFILGYAGWGAGQLEREFQDNAWLSVSPTHELVFKTPSSDMWHKGFTLLGIDPQALSTDAGHA